MHYTVAPSDCPPVRRSSYPSRVAALSLRAPPLTASSHRLLSTRTPTHAVWQHWTVRVAEGDRIDWADELTCARIHDRSVLLQFKMLLPSGEARALAGVERRRGCGAVHAAYAYLDVPADGDAEPNMADLVVHPDIVHDGGAEFVNPNRLLLELITIVAAEGYELEKCRVRVDGARNVLPTSSSASRASTVQQRHDCCATASRASYSSACATRRRSLSTTQSLRTFQLFRAMP